MNEPAYRQAGSSLGSSSSQELRHLISLLEQVSVISKNVLSIRCT